MVWSSSKGKASLYSWFPYLFKFSGMDYLSDGDVASKDLDYALRKKAGKQQFSLLKRTSGETWRTKPVIVYKAHFLT